MPTKIRNNLKRRGKFLKKLNSQWKEIEEDRSAFIIRKLFRSYYQIAAMNDRNTGMYRLEMAANAEAGEVELAPDFLKLVVPFWLVPLY